MSAPRLATLEDVTAIAELRAAMFAGWARAKGVDPATVRTDWTGPALTFIGSGIADGSLFAAVVDDEHGTPIASGIGEVKHRLPSPALPDGRVGTISSMYTRPEHRGRGHGAAIVETLIERFAELEVRIVELFAAPLAEPIYRRVGFEDRPGGRPLRIRVSPTA